MGPAFRRDPDRPHVCGFVANVDCSDRAAERVERRVTAIHSRYGRRVALIGHSPSGHYARAIAARTPERVSHAIKARQVIAEARDLLGGNGVLLENHVIRHMGDIEVIHTYEGTETMQTLIVGRDITGVGAFA